jgi:O-6-methylguanine DNA methyltransferase
MGTMISKLAQAVYQKLSEIPKGSVISYRELAKRVGAPQSIRAVATIVGKNPTPVKVPCHRVIRTNGELGEYTFGQGRDASKKLELLRKEGVIFHEKKSKNGKTTYILASAKTGAVL